MQKRSAPPWESIYLDLNVSSAYTWQLRDKVTFMVMKENREAAPEIYIIIDAKTELEKLNQLSPEIEKSLKKVYCCLVKKPRNLDTFPELLRAGVMASTWVHSRNEYPREYVCLWCGEKWPIKDRQKRNQWHCPKSCNVHTEDK